MQPRRHWHARRGPEGVPGPGSRREPEGAGPTGAGLRPGHLRLPGQQGASSQRREALQGARGIFATELPTNSARNDVQVFVLEGAGTAGRQYYETGNEASYAWIQDTQKYINGLLGITN